MEGCACTLPDRLREVARRVAEEGSSSVGLSDRGTWRRHFCRTFTSFVLRDAVCDHSVAHCFTSPVISSCWGGRPQVWYHWWRPDGGGVCSVRPHSGVPLVRRTGRRDRPFAFLNAFFCFNISSAQAMRSMDGGSHLEQSHWAVRLTLTSRSVAWISIAYSQNLGQCTWACITAWRA